MTFGDLRPTLPSASGRAVDRFAASGQGDVRPLAGPEDRWRLRVGDWRVIFSYDADTGEFLISRVLPRDRAYRD
jgi:mRNA-degrading endonuclease RelE of RelBE toxin-antitoxin system